APPVDTTDGESGAVNGGSDTGAEPSTTTVDAGPACDNPEPSGDCAARPAICFSNGDCTDGLCVNAQCRSYCDESSDCPTREACVLGLCRGLDALECTVQADCPEADDCVSGSCLRRCLNDSDCELCDDGPVCRLGY